MKKYIDNNFYCMDIRFNSIWIASFSINLDRTVDIKFINKRSIKSLFLNGKLNIACLEKEIRNVIYFIEKKIDEPIYSIYLTSDILNINSQIQQIYLNIGINKQVTNNHIKQSLTLLRDSALPENRSILQVIPIKYNIDIGSVANPVGYKTPDLFTTYNVITSDSASLTLIKNIFEKYQISVIDIISHNYLITKFGMLGIDKNLPKLFIDITSVTINISFVYKGKLVKCWCIQNTNLVMEYNSKENVYNVIQYIKSFLPLNILNMIKYIVVYSSIKSDLEIVKIVRDIFELDCKMLFNDSKNSSPIYYLVKYVVEQLINENDYFSISSNKLNIFGLLKDIITETL